MVNLKYQQYIVIETKDDEISLFNLYDDETKTIYEGEDKIKNIQRTIKGDFKNYFSLHHLILIPIKKAQFQQMLNFSFEEKIQNKNLKKFIKDHNLIEWSI